MSAAALSALDRAGARWCLLRTGTDLDVLVHPADVGLVRGALAGFDEQRPWGRRPHRFFVCGDEKLDVVTELAFGRRHELRTGAADEVLARRGRVSGVAVPAPADRFWALLLHELLDRRVTRREPELRELARGDVDSGPLAALVAAAGWNPAAVAALVADGRFEELRPRAAALRAHWPGCSPLAAAARSGVRAALRRAERHARAMR